MNYKILIVEDDLVIASQTKEFLTRWGYDAYVAEDFHNVMQTFVNKEPQLVLLDISLPFYNGFYWCQEIRKLSQVPILFLSSASEKMSIVMAMNMGADDFIAKPFDFDILLAKVSAILRRTYSFQGQTSLLEHHGVILNLSNATMEVNHNKVELTKNEFRILQILFEHKGEVVSKDAIIRHLWDADCFIDDNTLAVNLTRLRKKLEEVGLSGFITTKKGIGYLLES